MGTREAAVEKLLHDEITKLGGTTRKWVSPGRDGVMDQIVFEPMTVEKMISRLQRRNQNDIVAHIIFVEVKTKDGVMSTRQHREADTLRALGADVRVVYGADDVHWFIRGIK